MRTADTAWLTLAAGIITYDALAPTNELLSEAVDRYLTRRPTVTRVVVIIVAAHLLNLIPETIDPLHRLATWRGR